MNPLPPGKKVYVVGENGIGEELDLIGVPHLGGLRDAAKSVLLGPGVKLDHDPDVGAVVVGYDQFINYYKIQYAQLCINQNKGCKFIATNLDALSHMTDAQEWAAGGTMVGAIRGCTGSSGHGHSFWIHKWVENCANFVRCHHRSKSQQSSKRNYS